jgi:hypothetical protein
MWIKTIWNIGEMLLTGKNGTDRENGIDRKKWYWQGEMVPTGEKWY